MKTIAKKVLIISLVIITSAIIAFAKIPAKRVDSMTLAYHHLSNGAFANDYQMYPRFGNIR